MTIVLHAPLIPLFLEGFDTLINFTSEGNIIKLVFHGLMKALTDTIRLRRIALGLGVFNLFDTQIEFKGMIF